MKAIVAIIQPRKLSDVVDALQVLPGVGGITVTEVRGFGRQRGKGALGETKALGSVHALAKERIEVVVQDHRVDDAVEAIRAAASTGQIGDGKVFVLPVDDAMRIRTGERGETAL